MSHDDLDPAQLDELRHDLEALREQLVELLAQTRDEAKPVDLDKPIGRLSRMDDMQRQQLARAHRTRQHAQLSQVEAALRRLTHSPEDYGVCVFCQDLIGYRRLKARPESHACIPCLNRR